MGLKIVIHFEGKNLQIDLNYIDCHYSHHCYINSQKKNI
jgi:hypothetical protein